MADLTVPQPPLIDADGNINVHGRAGISLPFQRWTGNPRDPASTQLDISNDTLTLEIAGAASVPLVANPADPLGLLLLIDDLETAGILVTPGDYPPFVIRDTTGATPQVRLEGRFIARGWEGSPGPVAGASTYGGFGLGLGRETVVLIPQEDATVVVLVYAGPAGPLGHGIPRGGAYGQILVKLSGADYDFAWMTIFTVLGELDFSNPINSGLLGL